MSQWEACSSAESAIDPILKRTLSDEQIQVFTDFLVTEPIFDPSRVIIRRRPWGSGSVFAKYFEEFAKAFYAER